jgi:hypothetical protein
MPAETIAAQVAPVKPSFISPGIVLSVLCLFLQVPAAVYSQSPAGKLVLSDTFGKKNIVVSYTNYDTGRGNTSVAHDDENIYKWSKGSPFRAESWGYFRPDGSEVPYIKRDRDLGQTFTYQGDTGKKLLSVTVRLGVGSNVVRPGMYGQKLSLQLFEVTGTAVVNNNGSDSTTKAYHGFPHNRYDEAIAAVRDDYYEGEQYKSIAVFRGFTFPGKQAFGIAGGQTEVSPDDKRLKGKYLEFRLPAGSTVVLEPGKQYAFLIMIDEIGKERGFTLANNYYGSYAGGHGIRRDGDGVFPPVACNPAKNFTDPENKQALASAHFPADFNKRITISPGTNGYPDVDTWRDLVFFIEAE